MNMLRGAGRVLFAMGLIYWLTALTIAGHAYMSAFTRLTTQAAHATGDCWGDCSAATSPSLLGAAMSDLVRLLLSSGTVLLFFFGVAFFAVVSFLRLLAWINEGFTGRSPPI